MPKSVVSFTFDDAPRQDWTVIKPVLDDAGIKAGFAVPSSFPDGHGNLTWDQVTQLQSAGEEIIAHTVTHPHLTTLNLDQQVEEIDNREAYAHHGVHVQGFAYPFGEQNDELRDVVSHYYSYGLATSQPGASGAQNPLSEYAIRRIAIKDSTPTTDHFKQIDTAINNGEILVFIMHAGDGSFTPEGGGVKQLRDVIAYAQAHNVPIVTPSAAVSMAQSA
ncbi:MAG: polysaccharide deacetylase family protein [Mycobacterium sp.]